MALTPYRIAERALGLVSGHFPGEEAFVWDTFLPVVSNLPATSGLYAVEAQANYFGTPNPKPGLGDLEQFPEVIVGDLTSGTYSTYIKAFESLIARDWLTDAQDGIDVMERHANKVKRNVWVQQERNLWATLLSAANPSGWSTAALGALGGISTGTQWSTVATSNPIADLMATADGIRAASGEMPDALIMSYDVARWASINPIVRGYAGVSTAGLASGGERELTIGALKSILNEVLFGGAGRVEVLSALYNANNEALTPSLTDIAADTLWMGKLGNPQATIQGSTVVMDPVAAVRLEYEPWQTGTEELDTQRGVKTYGFMRDHSQAIDTNLGYLVTNVV